MVGTCKDQVYYPVTYQSLDGELTSFIGSIESNNTNQTAA